MIGHVTTDGFEMMIGFTGLFDTVCDYTLQFTITHTHSSVHNHVFTVVASQQNPTVDAALPLAFSSLAGFSYQLLTATSHN
jgi:hypothetical protein